MEISNFKFQIFSQRGEIATLLTVVTLGLMLVGTVVGTKLAGQGPREQSEAKGFGELKTLSNGWENCKWDAAGNTPECKNSSDQGRCICRALGSSDVCTNPVKGSECEPMPWNNNLGCTTDKGPCKDPGAPPPPPPEGGGQPAPTSGGGGQQATSCTLSDQKNDPGNCCATCIANKRQDLRTFYNANGWNVCNDTQIVNNWCNGILPNIPTDSPTNDAKNDCINLKTNDCQAECSKDQNTCQATGGTTGGATNGSPAPTVPPPPASSGGSTGGDTGGSTTFDPANCTSRPDGWLVVKLIQVRSSLNITNLQDGESYATIVVAPKVTADDQDNNDGSNISQKNQIQGSGQPSISSWSYMIDTNNNEQYQTFKLEGLVCDKVFAGFDFNNANATKFGSEDYPNPLSVCRRSGTQKTDFDSLKNSCPNNSIDMRSIPDTPTPQPPTPQPSTLSVNVGITKDSSLDKIYDVFFLLDDISNSITLDNSIHKFINADEIPGNVSYSNIGSWRQSKNFQIDSTVDPVSDTSRAIIISLKGQIFETTAAITPGATPITTDTNKTCLYNKTKTIPEGTPIPSRLADISFIVKNNAAPGQTVDVRCSSTDTGFITTSLFGSSNEIFREAMARWVNGEIGVLEMSGFVNQLTRYPGLQISFCDPRKGECNPTF